MTDLYPKVAIILLNWNQKKDTIDCLESLRKLNYANYEIIVVDQDSGDGTQDIIRARFPNVILIENRENVGFAEGNNIGIRKAFEGNTDYIFLLNNDTVVDIDILRNLIELAETGPEIGLVGAKIFYFDVPDKIWFAGGKMDWIRGLTVNLGAEQEDGPEYDQIKETDFISGCAFLIKRNVIEKIGLLDKRYFIYFEEVDWCLSARRGGYKIFFCPGAKVWHKVSSSLGTASLTTRYYFSRNRALFIWKNWPFPNKLIPFGFYLFSTLRTVLSSFLNNRKADSKILLKGLYDFLTNKFGKADIKNIK